MTGKGNFMQKTVVIWFGALICCAFWGSAFPAVKIGYRLFEIPAGAVSAQILFAGIRFTLAGLLIIFFGSIIGKRVLLPKKASIPRILKLSLIQTVLQYIFFYIGLANTTGVKGSIITATNVFLAIFVASLLFHQEKLTTKKVVGSLIGFSGVILINLTPGGMDASFQLMGEGLMFLASLSNAFASVYIKRYSQLDDPIMLTGYQFLAGGIVLSVIGFLFGGRINTWTAPSVMMLLYLGALSAIAYTLWSILLKYNPVSKVAVFGFMNPVIGVILSGLILGEGEQAFGGKSILALILVSVGIYITVGERTNAAQKNQMHST